MWGHSDWERYSVEEKLSPEYHALYSRLWAKHGRINLKDKETWSRIPEEERHIMLFEPPLRVYKYKVGDYEGSFIDAG